MNEVLIMTIICIGAIELAIVGLGAALLRIGNALIDLEERRKDECIHK